MKRGLLAVAAALGVGACNGGGSNALPPSQSVRAQSGSPTSPIAHVVVVVQENRSFDNLFGDFPGVDGAKRGKEKVLEGGRYVDKWLTLAKHSLTMKTDIGHCYYAFVSALDKGRMDGFDLEPKGVCPRGWGGGGETIGTTAYQYVDPKQIAPYWDLAQQYAIADHTFQTQGSGSFTSHQDLIRGATTIGKNVSLIDTPDGMPWGCDAPPKTVTDLLVGGKWEEDAGPFPCTSKFPPQRKPYTTLRDLLDAKGVSWKYYSPCFSGWKGCADRCSQCAGALLNAFDVIAPVRYGKEWGTNVSMPQTNVFDDVSNGALPAVSWVIPSDNDSDHPGTSVDNGPEWVASVVNAIGESSYWGTTAIVIVWDDWGGLYDHVKPAMRSDGSAGGFRVPMIVVSPYVPRNEISHTVYSFGSILRYVEDTFGLGSLGTTDQTSRSIANVFDYKQQPRSFSAIPARHSIQFFRNEPPPISADPE